MYKTQLCDRLRELVISSHHGANCLAPQLALRIASLQSPGTFSIVFFKTREIHASWTITELGIDVNAQKLCAP